MKVLKLSSLFLLLVFTSVTCAPKDDSPKKSGIEDDKKDSPMVISGPMKKRIKACLDHVASRDLLTSHHFWAVFHGILGQGFETTLLDEKGKKINAIEYICKGGELTGMKFTRTVDGIDVLITPGIGTGQGHQDQFIAEMAQWGMPKDKEFVVDGKKYPYIDFCRQSMAKASVKTDHFILPGGEKIPNELTWTIILIAQYFPEHAWKNKSWTNNRGETLTFEDVVRYELNEPINSAACGGTHRLFGLTWAYHLYLQQGGKTEGIWKEVADKLELYKKKARQFQNKDGGFSTNYVSEPGAGRSIGTTGHVLEWLALAMTDEELKEPWVEDSANALVQMIFDKRKQTVETGELYHAAHGLHIYYNRMFGPLGKSEPLIPLPPKK